MSKRVVVTSGMPPEILRQHQPEADICLDWTSDRRNALVSISQITGRCRVKPPEIIQDLFDIAVAVYLADIAILRGKNEKWTRSINLLIPVREPAFWQEKAAILSRTLHELTRDNFALEFCSHSGEQFYEFEDTESDAPDCVSALSGGVDSFAGAVMLLRADRHPLLLTHQSGNPYVRRARDNVVETLDQLRPGQSTAVCATIQPRRSDNAWSFPPAAERENSRRSRSFLFISSALLAAACVGVSEVYLCDNGVLTVALPLTDGRVGSLSTRSTHPVVIAGMNRLLEAAGVSVRVANPFVYQTKAELIDDILRPVLTPAEIQQTVSCWMTGRRSRQCGGCIPCLLRRISMLAAGLPDEAYEMDILATPQQYRGTDAYGNLVDLLSQANAFATMSAGDMLLKWPELLDTAAAGESVHNIIDMLQRYGHEVTQVVEKHFSEAAALMRSSE